MSRLMQAFLFICRGCVLAAILLLMLAAFWPDKHYTVVTGSMGQTIPPMSEVYLEAPNNLRVGDIVTYQGERGPVTHRVVGFKDSMLITKGDANAAQDPAPVAKEAVLGRVQRSIPYLGYPLQYLSPKGDQRVSEGGLVLAVLVVVLLLDLWLALTQPSRSSPAVKRSKKTPPSKTEDEVVTDRRSVLERPVNQLPADERPRGRHRVTKDTDPMHRVTIPSNDYRPRHKRPIMVMRSRERVRPVLVPSMA